MKRSITVHLEIYYNEIIRKKQSKIKNARFCAYNMRVYV